MKKTKRKKRRNKLMKKFYLVNGDTIETAHFKSNEEAFKEAQARNRYDRNAGWKAYDENGDAIYGVCIWR
jgi:hypothetical protein